MGFSMSRLPPCNSTCCHQYAPHAHLLGLKHVAPSPLGDLAYSLHQLAESVEQEGMRCKDASFHYRVVTANKATATAWETPNFGYFNDIEQGSSVTVGIEGTPCCHSTSHTSHPELPSRDRSPSSQRMMKISFTAQLPEFIYPRSVGFSCLPIFPEHSGLACAGRFRC